MTETVTLVTKVPRAWKIEYDRTLEGGDFTINSDLRGHVGVAIVKYGREKELEEMKVNFFKNMKEIYELSISEIQKKNIEEYESKKLYDGRDGINVVTFPLIEKYFEDYMGEENISKFDEHYSDLLHSYTSELDDIDDSMILAFVSLIADAYFDTIVEKMSRIKEPDYDYLMFEKKKLDNRIFELIKGKRR